MLISGAKQLQHFNFFISVYDSFYITVFSRTYACLLYPELNFPGGSLQPEFKSLINENFAEMQRFLLVRDVKNTSVDLSFHIFSCSEIKAGEETTALMTSLL